MRNRNKKKYKVSSKAQLGKVILHKTLSTVIFVLIILIFVAYSKEVIRAHNINDEIKAMEAEITKLEAKNNSIFHNIQYYKTLSFLEREARLKMGQSKDGEKVIIINDSEEYYENIEPESETVTVNYDDFNPKNWLNYFFGEK